ncbi:MAG TPA: dienelactone hydrolase family protein [Herbaspirillum sp.]|jgi:carboxymethylenebutenolidase
MQEKDQQNQIPLGSIFARTVSTLPSTTITTDAAGLSVGEISYEVKSEKVRAYFAQPEGKTDLPIVIVISEIYGVHAHIADVCRRWAKLGYLAIAPDLFGRQGEPMAYTDSQSLQREVIAQVADEQVIQDLHGALAWAGANNGNAAKAAVTGFCWGGRFVWLYCAHNPKIKAGVAWYGKVSVEKNVKQPYHPIDIAEGLRVPVLGLYGSEDAAIPLETIELMQDKIADGRSHSEIIIYPGAGHAFNADYRPNYIESAAKDGWQRAVEWLKKNGVS